MAIDVIDKVVGVRVLVEGGSRIARAELEVGKLIGCRDSRDQGRG